MPSYVRPGNARSKEQEKVLNKISKDKVCPFCSENLRKFHNQPILKSGKYWILTTNQWPYEHTKHHLLAITKKHVESIDELSPAAAAELFSLLSSAMKKYSIKGGAVGIRFGRISKPASSVDHLHVHLIEPNTDSRAHKDVVFKISKNPKKSQRAARKTPNRRK